MVAMNATSRLGAFVASSATVELAPDVATGAAICLIESLGLALASREEPTVEAARAMTTDVPSGRRTARIWTDA